MILLRDFNAHVGNDANVWKGVVGRHGDADVNDNGRLLLQLRCNNALCIMNSLAQRCAQVGYTWRRASLGQRSLIDFCIVSTYLFRSVLNVGVKRVCYCIVLCNVFTPTCKTLDF